MFILWSAGPIRPRTSCKISSTRIPSPAPGGPGRPQNAISRLKALKLPQGLPCAGSARPEAAAACPRGGPGGYPPPPPARAQNLHHRRVGCSWVSRRTRSKRFTCQKCKSPGRVRPEGVEVGGVQRSVVDVGGLVGPQRDGPAAGRLCPPKGLDCLHVGGHRQTMLAHPAIAVRTSHKTRCSFPPRIHSSAATQA